MICSLSVESIFSPRLSRFRIHFMHGGLSRNRRATLTRPKWKMLQGLGKVPAVLKRKKWSNFDNRNDSVGSFSLHELRRGLESCRSHFFLQKSLFWLSDTLREQTKFPHLRLKVHWAVGASMRYEYVWKSVYSSMLNKTNFETTVMKRDEWTCTGSLLCPNSSHMSDTSVCFLGLLSLWTASRARILLCSFFSSKIICFLFFGCLTHCESKRRFHKRSIEPSEQYELWNAPSNKHVRLARTLSCATNTLFNFPLLPQSWSPIQVKLDFPKVLESPKCRPL